MATQFDTIIDLALITVDDYKIAKLYNQDINKFRKWCDGLLISAIPNFLNCKKSLTYDTTTRAFEADLSNMEISILADLWAIEWFKSETYVAEQLANSLQISGGFKTHSPAQNFKEKNIGLGYLTEKVSQKMLNDYPLQSIDSIVI